jgi:hypothetical protein
VEEVKSEEGKNVTNTLGWRWGVKKEILVQDWTDQTVTVLTCAENSCKTGLGHCEVFLPAKYFLIAEN